MKLQRRGKKPQPAIPAEPPDSIALRVPTPLLKPGSSKKKTTSHATHHSAPFYQRTFAPRKSSFVPPLPHSEHLHAAATSVDYATSIALTR